jgi:putative glycosyltransferase (TIGR04348 family)
MIALHARRSYPSVRRFRRRYPTRPLVLALTGTDLYRDLGSSQSAQRSLKLANWLVTLQPLGIQKLPKPLRSKAVAIFQSAICPKTVKHPRNDRFEVCVIGHLRPVKDPLRAALAARLLPGSSRIEIVHVGGALDGSLARRAQRESRSARRYRWLGEVSHSRALRILAQSRLLVLTSKLEGGANVVGEALACDVPVLSSRIDGSVGLLGPRYPGYFAVGDSKGLARLLLRAERDAKFLRRLRNLCRQQARFIRPEREQRAWQRLLNSAMRRSP